MDSNNSTHAAPGESDNRRSDYNCVIESEVFEPVHQEIKPELHPPGIFPAPLVIQPLLKHKQTFLILHGRGSFATRFGPPLLAMTSSNKKEKLQDAFPHAKIIFVTASRNRATIYKRAYTHQWFDNWHLDDYTERQDLMSGGLHKSVRYLHGLLEKEIGIVGEQNVVLWGLSQGCATSLCSLLTWNAKPFAAMVGMCGWLPYSNVVKDIVEGKEGGLSHNLSSEGHGPLLQVDDPFANSDDEGNGKEEGVGRKDLGMMAVDYLREEIEWEEKKGAVFRDVPIFLGHGTEDDKVSVDLGREAKACLKLMGADVQLIEYEGLGHWYSPDMLGDIFAFLKEKLGP